MRASRAPRPRLPLFTGQPVSREALPAPRELVLHMSVAKELRRFGRSDWRWTHFPAGELRDEATGAKLKRMELRPGWPDFILLSPEGRFHGLELKRKGETLSDLQEDFAAFCAGAQVAYVCADTLEDAIAALQGWGVLRVTINGVGA